MEVVSKNVHWLLPEEPSPCDIFLYFRGKYAMAVPGGQAVNFKLLEKLAKAQCTHIYIRAGDAKVWDSWATGRYPSTEEPVNPTKKKDEELAEKTLYGNKRAELISYVQKSVLKKIEVNPLFDTAADKALVMINKVVKLPTLDWYFKQFHEPPDLLHHCGRVAYGIALFLYFRKVASEEEIERICLSALIHELEGNPVDNMKKVVSVETLANLEKNQNLVPIEVIKLIEMHDELCSGKGFPKNKKRAEIPIVVRIFSLFNHFDTYRLKCTGTRRARFERTKEMMTARIADYDPALWPLFWDFWEKHVEAIT